MQFAIVDDEGSFVPVVLDGASGDTMHGRHLNGEMVRFKVSDVVHAGLAGSEPNVVYQFCPSWVAKAMRRAGIRGRSIAANPEEDDDEGGKKKAKFSDPGHVKYHSAELIWNADSRRGRQEEGAYFASLSKDIGGLWSGYKVGHEFGYDQIKQFLQENREKQSPETLLWCMIFAALTSNEGTQAAEANLMGFSEYLRAIYATGVRPHKGMLTLKQLATAWSSGLLQNKFKSFNNLLEGFDRLVPALAYAKEKGLRGIELRRYVALTPGVTIPAGLGVTKFSFAMECWGENVGCLDRWMFRALGADERIDNRFTPDLRGGGPQLDLKHTNEKIAKHRRAGPPEERDFMTAIPKPPWAPFSEGAYVLSEYGGGRFSKRYKPPKVGAKPFQIEKAGTTIPAVLAEYEWWEQKLTRTKYYQIAIEEAKTDPRAALNPIARAQWTMWEDIMRRHKDPGIQLDKARHMPLWLAIHGVKHITGRVLVPYREHREEGARKERELLERQSVRKDRDTREEALRMLPKATYHHKKTISELEAARRRDIELRHRKTLLKNPRERHCDQSPCVGDTVRFSEVARKRHEVGANLFEVVEERSGGLIVYSLDGNGTERRMVLPSELVVVSRMNPTVYPEQEERIIVTNPMVPIADKESDPMGIVKGAQLVPLWPSSTRKTWGKISGPQDVWNLLKDSAKSPVERMYALLLDRRNNVLGVFVVGQGTISETLVGLRETFAPAIEMRASGIILAHNHPSGDPTPSQADVTLTARVEKAGEILGVALLDSVVLGSSTYTSFRDKGLLTKPNPRRSKSSREAKFCDHYYEHVKKCAVKSAAWPDSLRNPASSEKQRRLFGAALAYKRGESKGASEAVRRLARTVPEETLREFARRL